MMEYPVIIFAAVLVFIFGLFSSISARSPITAPMVFCLIGMFASPLFLNRLELKPLEEGMSFLAELALILILFVDASTIDLPGLIKSRNLPIRLLAIGLPLTMMLGFVVAVVMFTEFSWWMAALVAFILAPTDAALGQAVVNSPRLPERIRQSINVESGLNDGIALPLVMMCLAALSDTSGHEGGWLLFMSKQLLLAPIVGGFVGYAGGWLVERASHHHWMQETFQRLIAGSLALMAYAAAEYIGGNGFIAAYFAGLLLGIHTHSVRERIQEFGEAEGQQLSLFVFLVFGLVLIPLSIPYWDGTALLYALLSLTVIRMVPVALSLRGAAVDAHGVLFIGWFGPRGIASVLYLMIATGELGIAGYERAYAVITLTVLLSILLHGLTSVPLSKLYARKLDRSTAATDSPQT